MRMIKYIVIHCTAGYGDVSAIKRFWFTPKSKGGLGWKQVGYHYFIYTDGTVEQLAPIAEVTNGVSGHNSNSVHIAYQGGVDPNNVRKAVDTRTAEQKEAILKVIGEVYRELEKHLPVDDIKILGHRDFSPDKNGNGVIDSWERIKECPSFDAIPEYMWIRGSKAILSRTILCLLLSLTLFACGSRKKQMQQERERTEQTAIERTVEHTGVRSEGYKRDVELSDFEGLSSTTLYGAEGTINPDGSFTGKADSARTTAAGRNSKVKKSEEAEAADSSAMSLGERMDSLVHGKETNERIQEVRRSIPWYVWAGISVLVVFSLWFGVVKRGLLNWIFKLFK